MNIPTNLPVPGHREMWGVLDSTKLQAFAACPRSYFFEYVLGWRSDRPSNHLVFGRAWHEALEVLYKNGMRAELLADAYEAFIQNYRKDLAPETDGWFGGKNPEAALMGLAEYLQAYPTDAYDMKVLATEVYAQVPLIGDESLAVKLDCVFQDSQGKIAILEHKTGSVCGQHWAKQWELSIQVGAYMHACNVTYDQEATRLVVNGTFFKKTKREFQRVQCLRGVASMANWHRTVVSLLERIEGEFQELALCKDSDDVLNAFPMNPTACGNYAGCQFHDLCTCVGNPLTLKEIPIGFTEYWWNPLQKES